MRSLLLASALSLTVVAGVAAHCQVPCGIYDDPARIAAMREDATTIEKAIAGITELSGKTDPQSMNQLIRWTTTKEDHASHIIDVVSEYFLTQKLKSVAAGAEGRDSYLAALADHHAVMRAAMKAKQNANADVVPELRATIDAMAGHWK
jgi:nickel superoxide dismutase